MIQLSMSGSVKLYRGRRHSGLGRKGRLCEGIGFSDRAVLYMAEKQGESIPGRKDANEIIKSKILGFREQMHLMYVQTVRVGGQGVDVRVRDRWLTIARPLKSKPLSLNSILLDRKGSLKGLHRQGRIRTKNLVEYKKDYFSQSNRSAVERIS